MKNENNKNKQSIKTVISSNLKILRICFDAAPLYMWMKVFDSIRHELIIFLEFTYGLNFVLECAEFGKPFSDVLKFLIFLLTLALLSLVYDSFLNQKIQVKAQPVIRQKLKQAMYDKAAEIDLKCYDDPKVYNDFVFAVSEADNQIGRAIDLLTTVGNGITVVILSGGFFIGVDPISFAFVAVSFVLSLFSSGLINKFNLKLRTQKNPLERKLSYINRVFYLNDYAKEVRLHTELSGEILKDFDSTNDELLAIDKKAANKRFALEMFKNYVANDLITDVLYMIYLVFSAAVLHRISYSNVVVLRNAAGSLRRSLMRLSGVLPAMQEISLYNKKIEAFMSLEPTIISTGNRPMPPSPREIELKNVSFAYSEADGDILRNVSMRFNALEKTAIVGYNGAGKTTLIKLLMRLYDPTEGEILLDGVNIKEYPLESYRAKIGTIFQDFKIFAATVKENVLLDVPETETEAKQKEDAAVMEAIEKGGFDERLKTLENGLDTELTTEFDDNGVNLSGGESQKLAVSRAFYKDANLIILDEPSSALDPIAEYSLNRSMLETAEHKTVIFISHRLSTTRIADKIYMLENGSVIESGTHSELLSANGKYSQMWLVQAGQYSNTN
jgi:ATP-binding cassette subfamily B protein